jgi:hypothetical protein
MIVEHAQRWTERRASRRPAGELIRTAAYDVAAIESAAVARAFVVRHHYSASASSTAHRYGLYCRGDLVGVALFGPPASMAAHRAVFPTLTIREAVTFGRLVLLDSVPGIMPAVHLCRVEKACRRRIRPRSGITQADGLVSAGCPARPIETAELRGRWGTWLSLRELSGAAVLDKHRCRMSMLAPRQ